jgi:uncharacterized protein YcbK (DUF882 family)
MSAPAVRRCGIWTWTCACRLAGLRDIALAAQTGGVGYYPASDFVHVDIGRVRRW